MVGFGAFGKMPSLGDFFRINAPSSFVDPWDVWMQTGLREVRNALKERWSACYMSAPIWRFTLTENIAGPRPMLGIVMPSVDRVGREYPLTLMASVPVFLDQHCLAGETFETLEDIALGALEDDMTRDRLGDLLMHVPHFAAQEMGPADSGQQSKSVWTAQTSSGPRSLNCSGLPTPIQLNGLFDLSAPMWRVAATASESTA